MTLARYAAIVPVAADQSAVAIACWDAASGKPRLEFTELGTLAPRRATPAWGDPPLLVQLKHDLQACGIKVLTHHVLVPDTDACRRAGLMAMAYAAWSWRRRHTLDSSPRPAGTILQ